MLNYSTDSMCVRVYEYLRFFVEFEKQDVRMLVGCAVVCDSEVTLGNWSYSGDCPLLA